MARYKVVLEYDGATLIGFQENKDGDSVQALVRDAVFKCSGERVDVVGCGRTDAGVHAIAMPAHFDLPDDARLDDPATLKRAINYYLIGAPVSVVSCEMVPDDWHARFTCRRRSYRYVIACQDFPPVLDKDRVWWIPQNLDVEKMREGARDLVGNHDFSSFRAAECQAKSPVKTLDRADISVEGTRIFIDFTARSFLHRQVRNMVGTLAELGRGKDIDIKEILSACDRTVAGPAAPATGLFFMHADY